MKIRPYLVSLALVLSLAVLLAACGSQTPSAQETPPTRQAESGTAANTQTETVVGQATYPNLWVEEVPRIDEQGAVVVEIVPLNPNNPGGSLDFSVSLNTHSVDLSMDLASLATLVTDTGHKVQATLWEAPRGGHHVQGILSFPAGVDGVPLLEGASKITLTLVNVDSPERVFVWER